LVTDFLYIGIGPLHTGIFNLADLALVLALVALLLERPLSALFGFRGPAT
jgi:lipoprotein signal peptidase